jgi:hypothetical protein
MSAFTLRFAIDANISKDRNGSRTAKRENDGVGFGVGRHAKAYLAVRRCCCITGECGADDPVVAEVADVVIVGGAKLLWSREFISTQQRRSRFSARCHVLPVVIFGSPATHANCIGLRPAMRRRTLLHRELRLMIFRSPDAHANCMVQRWVMNVGRRRCLDRRQFRVRLLMSEW